MQKIFSYHFFLEEFQDIFDECHPDENGFVLTQNLVNIIESKFDKIIST